MDFAAVLPTFVITLREGVEAALVVGIVLAYLKKANQTYLNHWVYGGIGVGLVISALIGQAFGWIVPVISALNPAYAGVVEPLMEAIFSGVAIGMLSWMLIWMTQNARSLKQQVEGSVSSAIGHDERAGWGIFSLIFFAILREGFETVLFISTNLQKGPLYGVGALLGIAAASGIGVALFKFGVRLNLRVFFKIMGVFLLLIVAGLVVKSLGLFDAALKSLAMMDRKSAALCFFDTNFAKPADQDCILGPMVWNLSRVLPEDGPIGIVFNALFGYQQRLYLVQAIGYVVFLVTVGGLYFRSLSGKPIALFNWFGRMTRSS